MAMSATARRSESRSSKLQPDFNTRSSPLRPAPDAASRVSTPRPSVSPLSTPSKRTRSPLATRDAAMTTTEAHEPVTYNGAGAGAAETGEHDDDRSSSLSEPEDDQDDMLHEEDEPVSAAPGSLDVDSEAETERLDQTPRKLRKHANSIAKTPSKLSHAATVDDGERQEEEEEDDDDDDLLSDPPPSPLPADVGAASSTSTIETAGKKRKRSDTAASSLTSADSDDLGESPRKRSHESLADTHPPPDGDDSSVHSADGEEVAPDSPAPREARTAAASSKTTRGKRGKPPGRKPIKGAAVVADADADLDADSEQVEEPEEPSPHDDESGEEEAAAKAAEEDEREHKVDASSMFEEVAKQFTAFRERLYNERLATMNAELQLLAEPDCQHPEYLRQVACVDARRAKQIREANAYHYYRVQALRQRTIGDRAQLHSQYFQEIHRVREKVLDELDKEYCSIRAEWREQHLDKDDMYIVKFPTKKSTQIRQQAKYNQEVSVLSGVAKYVGFPAAPDIRGAEGDRLEEDLKAMKIAQRAPAPAPAAHRPPPSSSLYSSLPPISAQNERLAHDQFIEQNAWAQPQRPIHTHGTPNFMHTPDWATEPAAVGTPPSARNLLRNFSGQFPRARPHHTSATPLSQKQAPSAEHPMPADGADLPSSVAAAAAPPTSDRTQPWQGSSAPTSPLVVHKHRQNGVGPGAELAGFRNFSNISGASTIDAAPDSAEKPREPYHHSEERSGAGAAISFRPQDGVFGTPAPLRASTGSAMSSQG